MAVRTDLSSSGEIAGFSLQEGVRNYLSTKRDPFPFQRSNLGFSGQTYLPLDPSFRIVIKWQNEIQTEAEHLCSEFYSRVFPHLSVPRTELICATGVEDVARQFFIKESIPSIQHPMLMEYKDGNNLNKIIKNEKFFQLPVDQIKNLFFTIGEVAGYDLLIGNSDRFLPEGFHGEIDLKHKVNGGNIMIELVVPTTAEEVGKPPKIKMVHVIDNAPDFPKVFSYDERRIKVEDKSPEMDGGFSLFLEEGETIPEEEEKSPVKESPPLPSGDDLRTERRSDFAYYVQGGDDNLTAHQIMIGIQNEAKSVEGVNGDEVDKFFNNEEISTAMREGLCKGLQRSRACLAEGFQMEMVENVFGDPKLLRETSQILLDFIKLNLVYAKNQF